jgi:hypothetical protein
VHDELTVSGGADVELDPVGPESPCRVERLDGVLGVIVARPTVTDDTCSHGMKSSELFLYRQANGEYRPLVPLFTRPRPTGGEPVRRHCRHRNEPTTAEP